MSQLLKNYQEEVSFQIQLDLFHIKDKVKNINGINKDIHLQAISDAFVDYLRKKHQVKIISTSYSPENHVLTLEITDTIEKIKSTKDSCMKIIGHFSTLLDNWICQAQIEIPIPGPATIRQYVNEVSRYIEKNLDYMGLDHTLVKQEVQSLQKAKI